MNSDQKIENEPDFPLTEDGLAANKAYLKERREAGDPDYQYKGNATKTFVNRIVDANFDAAWARVRSMSLPSRLEKPITDRCMENEIRTLVKDDKSWKARSPTVRKFHDGTFNSSNRAGHDTPNGYWKRLQDDPTLFREFYHNRLRCSDFYNEFKKGKEPPTAHWGMLLSGIVPDFIMAIGLDTSRKCPLVSYFKPALAKYLTKKYLSGFSEVGDSFSGMSGRMLGVLATGKKYVGFDLNPEVIEESKRLMEFAAPIFADELGKEPEWSLDVANATVNRFECESFMTCSPYGETEVWSNGKIRSTLDCDGWIDVVLENVKAERYVFVTDDSISKYRPFVTEKLENFSHFGTNFEDVVVIDGKHNAG